MYSDRDMYESESHYVCIYCNKEGIKSRRSDLDGEIVQSNLQTITQLKKGKSLLEKMINSNPNEKEIEKFAEIIVEFVF